MSHKTNISGWADYATTDIAPDTIFVKVNDNEKPFFTSKFDEWAFINNVAEDLYKMVTTIDRDTAALAHVDMLTGDMETLRYLVKKVWEHYHALDDRLFDVYRKSDEYDK